MTEEERKLTGKVLKSEIERTESGGETTMVALELLYGERKADKWRREAGEWQSVARREIRRG